MRCLLMLLLLYCLLDKALARPSETQDQDNEGEVEDAEYDKNDDTAPEEAHNEDDDAPLNDQGSRDDEEDGAKQTRPNRNEYVNKNGRSVSEERMPRNRKDAYDNFSEYDMDKRNDPRDDPAMSRQQEGPPTSKHRQSDRYVRPHDTNDQLVENPANPSSSYEDNQMQTGVSRNDANGRRRSGAQTEDESELVLENTDNKREQVNKVKKNDHNEDENAGSSEQYHLYRKYYNPLQNENKESEDNRNDENRPEDANRDRRESQASSADRSDIYGSNDKKEPNNNAYEDDQAAIKRHIKKLSNDELDELLSSLSEDKRALLQKIIESDASNEMSNFNKREITKKAGAVEENLFLEGGQDSNKISGQVLNVNTDNTVCQNNDNTESTKTNTGELELVSTKSLESNSVGNFINKESTHSNEESATDKLESINLNSIAPPAELETTKNENKREVDLSAFSNEESDNDLSNESQDPANYQSYVCSRDEDLSQLTDDEVQVNNDNRNMPKRETFHESDADLADSMKSLQESFPNSNAYDDSRSYAGSDMAPLIRVKRRNTKHVVEKRAAAVLPASNLAYVPYRAENEDEDNDEGNEFYDDGFFDRTANFAKSNGNKQSETHHKLLRTNSEDKLTGGMKSKAINNRNSDTMSVGSDTDSVLSGVEGVDDNLMLNGGARKKRAAEKGSKLEPAEDLIKENMLTCPQRSTTSGDSKDKSVSFSDGVHFDGNEAFGPLPRNYDVELSRYKRIRRLKQSVDNKELSSTEATGQ